MPLITIVEDYVWAAMHQAVVERFANGMLAATVPGCPEVVASGPDEATLRADLFRRLEEWVRLYLASGATLPVFGGIDLNTPEGRRLATYHAASGQPSAQPPFVEDEGALFSTLAEWDQEDGVPA